MGTQISTPTSVPIQKSKHLFFVCWELGLKKPNENQLSDLLPSLSGINLPKPPTLIPFDELDGVSTRSHLWIAAEVSPVPISLYVTMNKFKGGLMDTVSRLYRFNSENWVGMHRQVRS
jgi:hypothetical protein